ncbi:MAG: polymerase subunit gamma/tau, partial [Ilumatobacteraceae bacterium]|nr:polymerase subunit gamma/tau [Ilumatobacteraceae bacterium]
PAAAPAGSAPPAPPEPAAAPPSEPVATPPATAPSPGDPGAIWADQVLPALAGLAKGMYQSADLVSLDGGAAVVRVDNDHHRQNCERKRADVERVLSDVAGQPVTITFEVGGSNADSPRPAGSSRPASQPKTDDPDEHLAGADVHDLDDAPDAPAGGLAALTEAFPGAELLDEQ